MPLLSGVLEFVISANGKLVELSQTRKRKHSNGFRKPLTKAIEWRKAFLQIFIVRGYRMHSEQMLFPIKLILHAEKPKFRLSSVIENLPNKETQKPNTISAPCI